MGKWKKLRNLTIKKLTIGKNMVNTIEYGKFKNGKAKKWENITEKWRNIKIKEISKGNVRKSRRKLGSTYVKKKGGKKSKWKDKYRGQPGKFISFHLFYSRIYISISDLFTYQSTRKVKKNPWNSNSRKNDRRRERKNGRECCGKMREIDLNIYL